MGEFREAESESHDKAQIDNREASKEQLNHLSINKFGIVKLFF